MATAEDAAAAARARDEIENQTNVVYAAALAWVALHGEDEEPAEDSALARSSKTLALMLLRSMRRMTRTKVPQPTGEDRQAWITDQAREMTDRAVGDARSHWSTVYKRMKKADPDVTQRTVQTAFADDKAWSDAAARTRATRLAAESALSLHDPVEKATGEPHSKMWISRGDPKVRTSHRRLHGQVHAIGSEFKEGLQYPGDPKAPLDETINCRCALFLVPTSEAAHAEEVFHIPEADFDVPMVAAAPVRAWAREQAKRDWRFELGIHG